LRNFTGKQGGLSLIELMIAIVIGVFISLMVVQYMVTSSRIFKRQGADTSLELNANFALSFLTEYVRQAGTRTPFGTVVPFYTGSCGTAGSCTFDSTNAASAIAPATSDSIAVQMRTENGFDCTGVAVPDNNIVANVFYIDTLPNSAGINSLFCRGFDVSNGNWLGAGAALVDGIDQMQVLYGVSDANGQVVSYLDASRVPPVDGDLESGWDRVRAVKIAVLVSDGLDTNSEDLNTVNFQLLDGPQLGVTDRISRRVFSTTITINNKLI